MMKNRRFLSVIALILMLVMVFTSCDSSDGKDGSDPSAPIEPNRSEQAKAWTEYLVYDAPEAKKVLSASKLFENVEFDDRLDEYKDLLVSIEETETKATVNETEIVTDVKTEKWYSKATGALVNTVVSSIPDVNMTGAITGVDVNTVVNNEVNYTKFLEDFIEIKKSTLVLKTAAEGQEPYDATLWESYEIKTEYIYYYSDGALFLSGLEAPITERAVGNVSASQAGYYLIDCEEKNKTYLMNEDGKVLREFEYKMEYNIPVYDEESSTTEGEYAYFEAGNYKYFITEAEPQYMPLGELVIFLVPGMSIRITDANDNPVAKYESECYGVAGYAVLGNGNVYICEYHLLNKDAAEYDVMSLDDKLNVSHKIINVTDGSVTEIDRTYVAQKLFNNNTKKINTFLNLATLEVADMQKRECLLDTAAVKDGFFLAEIQKFENGKLDTNSSFAVLNENLEIVAELPKIVDNQFSYPAFMSTNQLIVSARTANNKVIYYMVDSETGKTTLAPGPTTILYVERIKNGYFYRNRVYDLDWKLLYDFNKSENVSNFSVIDGMIYYRQYYSNDSQNYSIKRAYVNKSSYDGKNSYSFTSSDFLSYNPVFYAGQELIRTAEDGKTKLYNINGQCLITYSSGEEYIHSVALGSDVRYDVRTVINYVYEEDGFFVVEMKNTYSQTSHLDQETGLQLSYVKYEYQIIK